MKRSIIWGATIYGGGTLLPQFACASLRGGGEKFLLFEPWAVVFSPLWLGCQLFHLDWRVGAYRDITTGMLLAATALNLILGALLGAAIWKLWQLARGLLNKPPRSTAQQAPAGDKTP